MSLRKLTFSFLAILIVTVSPLFYVSCSDTETTDSSNFALYYTGLTNIAPSMTGTISKPTYKGSALLILQLPVSHLTMKCIQEIVFRLILKQG